MNSSEQAFNTFIHKRLRLMAQPNSSSTVTYFSSKIPGEPVYAGANNNEFVEDDDQSIDDSTS